MTLIAERRRRTSYASEPSGQNAVVLYDRTATGCCRCESRTVNRETGDFSLLQPFATAPTLVLPTDSLRSQEASWDL